jgi:acyl-CoA reductase-like NAD-dependent aldehyde dehydrogenase
MHLPILRRGVPYRSVETVTLRDLRSGSPVAEASLANRGLIARDLGAGARAARLTLSALPLAERLAICRRAATLFAEAELPMGWEGEPQSIEDYLRDLSATSGLPESLLRANVAKLKTVLAEMPAVLGGLTRDLPEVALDPAAPAGDGGAASHYQPLTDALGAVLPSNSPGVHGLWLPAIALGIPLALKPGREEPWTPLRLLRALAAAGCPEEALGFYPSDHSGAAEILLRAGRSLVFGDAKTVGPWKNDPRVQIHGPGLSKVIFGADQVAEWPRHLETVVSSVLQNGGRSCLNASGVWLQAEGSAVGEARQLAMALARRLAAVEARPLAHPQAQIAAFPAPATARRVSAWIDQQLETPGAEDLTAALRGTPRVAEVDGCTFLLPTVLWVSDPEHPLAHAELLFPFCAVVAAKPEELLERIGPTLVATALTGDPGFRRALLDCPAIDHLNFGPVPTWQISFAQPHEGNLFEHLYRRRAIREVSPELVGAAW